MTTQAGVLEFDADGNIRGTDAESWSADAGAGFSVTLIFSAGSFTDTDNYERSATRSLDWGLASIESPPKSLNRNSDLEAGVDRVQLTTNSMGIGQHTLEMNR